MSHTVEELVALMDAAPSVEEWLASRGVEGDAPEQDEPFPIVHLLVGEPKQPPATHVKDLLIDRDINLFAGHGGSAKTVVLLLMAICVVLDLPVFGTLKVHRAGPVLLVVPEDGESGARMILDALIEGLGLPADQRATLAEQLIMISDETPVDLTVDAAKIGATARSIGAVLVILDPLRNLIGGTNENDNDIAGPCVDSLRREVGRGAGATVVLSHHLRKAGKDADAGSAPTVHDMRGAGAWVNGARLAFIVSKRDDRITVKAEKSNRLRPDIRHELDLSINADAENEARWLSCRLIDANAGASSDAFTPGRARSLNPNERALLSCLDDRHEPGKLLSHSRLVDDSGLNKNTLKSIKKRMLDADLMRAVPTGRPARSGAPEYYYEITDAGRAVFASEDWING